MGAVRFVRRSLAELRRIGVRVFLAFTGIQAVLVAGLIALAEIRKRRHGPGEGFPWEEQPEVELDSGARMKLYPFGVKLYEAMLEEIEGAEETIFVGTFIWKGDELGKRFVEALRKKAIEGVKVCVIFDGLRTSPCRRRSSSFPRRSRRSTFAPCGVRRTSPTRETSSATTGTR